MRKVNVLVSLVNFNKVHHVPANIRFISRHFDYEDVIYDTQPCSVLFSSE